MQTLFVKPTIYKALSATKTSKYLKAKTETFFTGLFNLHLSEKCCNCWW